MTKITSIVPLKTKQNIKIVKNNLKSTILDNCNVLQQCPNAFVIHASGTGQLQAIPHVVDPMLSHGKPTRREVTMMESNDLDIGDDHLLEQSC